MKDNKMRYTKKNVINAFRLLLTLCGKEEYKNCNDPKKIGKWRLTYNSFSGYYIEEIVNNGGAIRQPLGYEAYTAQEFCKMVHSLHSLTLHKVLTSVDKKEV
jgi:hypothetical protein